MLLNKNDEEKIESNTTNQSSIAFFVQGGMLYG